MTCGGEKAADDKTVAEIRARRARSAIPDEVRHREKWRLALDMLDEVAHPAEIAR